jgi:hypothetical protein
MPSPTVFLETEEEALFDVMPRHIERGSVQKGNGQTVPRVTHGLLTSGAGLPGFSVALRGLSGAGAGNAVNTNTLSQDMNILLTALSGGTVIDGPGDTLSGTPGSGTTLLADGAVSVVAGQGILLMGDTGNKYVARQVSVPSGSNFNIDRDLTTDANVSDNPEANTVCYGGRTYVFSAVAPQRPHWALDAEGDNYRTQFWGILSGGSLSFSTDGYAKLMVSDLKCTDHTVDDELAVANPTYSAPTRGSIINTIDCPMWIGSDAYITFGGLEINCGITLAPRGGNGPNGPFGFVVTSVKPTFSWSMVRGTGTTLKEITDTIAAVLRGDTVQDCAWQFGRSVGATAYVRAPAMNIVMTATTRDGLEVFDCVGTPTDASAVTTSPGALYTISLF